MIQQWRHRQLHTFEMDRGREELYQFFVESLGFEKKPDLDEYVERFLGLWTVVNIPFGYGMVAIHQRSFDEKTRDLVEQLAEGLSLGYLRFLDFQRLEEQTRQARLEAAVQQVRAEVLAMKQADDLDRIIALMWQALGQVGVDTDGVLLGLIDEERGRLIVSFVLRNDMAALYPYPKLVPDIVPEATLIYPVLTESELFERFGPGNRRSRIIPIGRLTPEELQAFKQTARDIWGVEVSIEFLQHLAYLQVTFPRGNIEFLNRLDFTEDDLHIAEAFTEVIDLAFARVLDFQRLEEQNQQLTTANEEVRQALEEKEQAQEALVRSESMAAIGTLAAGAAHELNNPMGAAASLVQTVQEMAQEASNEEWVEDRSMIVEHLTFSRKELDRAKDIVASLLELSRQSQDYTEEVDLQTVAQDALRGLHDRYSTDRVTVEENYPADLPTVQGNFAQLVQVALNLVTNAVDAMCEEPGQISLRTYTDGDQAVFECRDTGVGISDEVRQDIFKPFFTTKAPGEGTGLGLYVCHQIVDKHGGTIEVDSTQGQGTQVRVRLPISKD